ncbi:MULTISPECIES: DNA ligase D [unclassified Pseudoxanthomonas]|uniref:DNA ligase D n=1 Tax=unclassified Pseudoxanthomonas TaxID=2645906 RepID=UPI0016196966|nr:MULTISPECIES: DNA ligase D [unclassified Pseudoxanthomonas]MBB3275174.1 bifunctional non-homologous end joining protein LigD [Pseudoxanthomonas sp. OG2]MBD9379058.1 DNA ligase D [Pseudoxanthomonas sp. PXM04]MBV7473734.1 DNA ligase D [Pseudoxanthomonas sp. PXM05]
MSLVEYQRKRHFGRTREPAPGRTGRAARPIFVVQLHHASHRHYDFRLQVGDALKSWAVPKGPSLDPQVKRLAAEVEDHPIAYADFQGEIPEGEYGAGHVALFDRGLWATRGDPEAQLAKGHLRFELFGDKLKGGWHLVRTGRASARPQWLLFKDEDDYAAPGEADDMLDDVAAPTAGTRRGRVVKPGVKARKTASRKAATGTRARVSPRTIEQRRKRALALAGARRARLVDGPFKPQLAMLGSAPPMGDDWLHEAKWDGYRLLTVIRAGQVRIWSRNALEWTAKVPEIVDALAQLGLQEAALDGELIAGAGTQADFSVLQATLSGEKNAPLSYVLFDLLHLEGVDTRRVAQVDRKHLLETVLKKARPPIAYSPHVQGHGDLAFAAAAERHLEGIISKRADAPYRAGRGDDWRKSKRQESDEFAVAGMTPPKGSRAGFGSLLLARPDGRGGWRFAGRVGTGFSQATLAELGERLGRRARATPTVDIPEGLDTDLRGARWFPPEVVVEVFYRGVGNQGLLRQPSLKGLRPDKTAADLRSSDRKADMADKANGKTAGGKTGTTGKRGTRRASAADDGIELTHPGRVVYPDTGKTKQDVADYYDTVMAWLLPEISGRPLSIIRCPQGSTRPCFFQKHLAAGMQYVDSVPVEEESGQTEDYLVARDARAVRELVQFNALEFHPWGAHADDPDRADRVVFDLDPGADVSWAEIVAAARQMRGLLEEAGLQSFVRTSGGKGLHVVVPLRPACGWDQVKPFAHAFAESMARMEPLKYVATSSKRLRKGRIFIDYLRNGRGATSVASFSLRARPGAPVAMPLRWEELGRVKGGNAFDIDSAPARLRRLKQHPWAGIERIRQNLAGLTRGD